MNKTKEIAQSHMTAKVPIVRSDQTIADIKDILYGHSGDIDTINYVYVVSKNSKLVGVLSLDNVFIQPDDTPVRKIMVKNPISARPHTDQERVAHLALKHNIKAIPVIDKNGKFLGVVPNDKILDILEHEHEEDILQMSGILPSKTTAQGTTRSSVLSAFFSRTPWIIIGIIGGILAAKVIGLYESVIEREVILATFIPLVVYVSNAVGVQSQTLIIRDLAVNSQIPLFRYCLKQLATSSLIALVCWLLIAFLTYLGWQSVSLGLIIGSSAFFAIHTAVIIALTVPIILKKLNLDPAIGSGPFTTIIQDTMAVLIYFSIVSLFY